MRTDGNPTEPSLENKRHAKVFPNWTSRSFPWPVSLCVMGHYREEKWLCVVFFDNPVVFLVMLDLNQSFAVASDSCWQFHQVLAAHSDNSSDNKKPVLSANRSSQAQNSTCWCLYLVVNTLVYRTLVFVYWKSFSAARGRRWRCRSGRTVPKLMASTIFREIPVSYF